jgi:hypothetical protein
MRWSYASGSTLPRACVRVVLLAAGEAHLERLHDLLGHLVLHREDVLEVAVEAVGPDVAAALGVDELHVDAHLHAGTAHAAFEHVAHAELAAHLLDVDALLLVRERRVARDHEQARDLGNVGDDVFGDAVGEVLLLGVAAHVGERQHRERGLVGQAQHLRRCGRCGRGGRGGSDGRDLERAHRVVDVLHLLLALVEEIGDHAAAHRAAHRVRHGHAARLGERLQPRGDVHAVAVDAAVGLLDHVAEMHADPKAHLPPGRRGVGGEFELLLRLDRGGHRAGGGLEHGKHGVARHVDHLPLIRLDPGAEHPARRVERSDGGMVVARHQAREPHRVRGEDGRQSLLVTRLVHALRQCPGS